MNSKQKKKQKNKKKLKKNKKCESLNQKQKIYFP